MAAKRKRILVLSASAGAGHVRAAQALCETAEREFPGLQLTHIDVLDLVPPTFRTLYFDGYLKLIEKAPLLWAYLYQHTDKPARESKISSVRRQIERLNTRKLYAEIEKLAPDAIVCTHFLAPELLSRRIRKGHRVPPVFVQVTDFDVHALWIHPHMRGYFVANEEIAWRTAQRGIAASDIHVTGIPISPQFLQRLDRFTCAREIGLDPQATTLLVMAGGAGVGDMEALVERVAAIEADHEFQIIALAGRNEKLLAKLNAVAQKYPEKIFPMGFTRTIERLMKCADIAVTKPGGLTTSECLAMGSADDCRRADSGPGRTQRRLPARMRRRAQGQRCRRADVQIDAAVVGAGQTRRDARAHGRHRKT